MATAAAVGLCTSAVAWPRAGAVAASLVALLPSFLLWWPASASSTGQVDQRVNDDFDIAGLIPGLDFYGPDDFGNEDDEGEDVSADGVCVGAVQVPNLRGLIGGSLYIGALTCGDGACGLHAIWGTSWRDGAHLACHGVRERFVDGLPASYRDLCKLHNGGLRDPLIRVLESVWSDQALRVAKAAAGMIGQDMVSDWDEKIWSHVPSRVQEDYRDLVWHLQHDIKDRI